MSCSAIYHLAFVKNEKTQKVLARLDYGGISILIFGTSFPVLHYGVACDQVLGKQLIMHASLDTVLSYSLPNGVHDGSGYSLLLQFFGHYVTIVGQRWVSEVPSSNVHILGSLSWRHVYYVHIHARLRHTDFTCYLRDWRLYLHLGCNYLHGEVPRAMQPR